MTTVHDSLLCGVAICVLACNWNCDALLQAAQLGIKQYRDGLSTLQWLQVRSSLLEGVVTVSEVLGQSARSGNDSRLRSQWCLLSGYFELLGVDLQVVLDSQLSKLMKSLCSALEPECQPGQVRHVYSHMLEEATIAAAMHTLKLLGHYSEPWMLASHVVNALSEDPPKATAPRALQIQYAKQLQPLLLIYGQALEGVRETGRPLPFAAASMVFQALLTSPAWELSTCQAPQAHVSSEVMSANACLVVQCLRCMGCIAKSIGEREDADELISQRLYPLLTKVADSNAAVSAAATKLLEDLREVLQYSQLEDMLRANLDYLVDDVVAVMRDGMGGDKVVGALEGLLRFIKATAATPLVRDLMRAVLGDVDACLLDDKRTIRSVGVMRAIVNSIDISEVKGRAKDESKHAGFRGGISERGNPWLQQLLVEYATAEEMRAEAAQRLVAASGGSQLFSGEACGDEGEHDGDEREHSGDDLPDVLEANKAVVAESTEVTLLCQVLDRCRYFLSTPKLMVQVEVLRTMQDCLLKMASLQVESALLPHIHQLWPHVMACCREHTEPTPAPSRFRSSSLLLQDGDRTETRHGIESAEARQAVLLHVFELVAACAKVAGSYMSLKIGEELWPLLKVLIRRHLRLPHIQEGIPLADKLQGVQVQHRMSFKIQMALLNTLEAISTVPECQAFMAPLVGEIAKMTVSSLSKHAPPKLHDAGIALFRQLVVLDEDNMWLILAATSGWDQAPPLPSLPSWSLTARCTGDFPPPQELFPLVGMVTAVDGGLTSK
ncbi:unnamed protein product [Chrysoparadoxa australica]